MIEAVIRSHAPEASIRAAFDGEVVTVFTPQPGLVIGRRGAVATAIRDELAERLGRTIQLRVIEDGGEGGAGVREPAPRPGRPPAAEAVVQPPFEWDPDQWKPTEEPSAGVTPAP